MNNNKDLKQIIILVIILVIIIIFSIVINVMTNNTEIETEDEENEIIYEINGITEEELEEMKDYLDEETYNEYKTLFEEYKEGITPYVSEEDEISEENKLTEEEQQELLNEADENGEYYYYTTEDGTVTDIKIYSNITFD